MMMMMMDGRGQGETRSVNEEGAKDYERRKLLSILAIFRGAPLHLSPACSVHRRIVSRRTVTQSNGNDLAADEAATEFIIVRLP